MSQENVELVRLSLEAFARGEFETAFSFHAPETEWRTAPDEPDPQTYRGIEGLRQLVEVHGELWEDRFGGAQAFEEFLDRGEWVVAPWSARLRGRGSGIEVVVYETWAVRLAGGRIVRVEEYRSKEEALEAVARAG